MAEIMKGMNQNKGRIMAKAQVWVRRRDEMEHQRVRTALDGKIKDKHNKNRERGKSIMVPVVNTKGCNE